jgi:hypothetical protein
LLVRYYHCKRIIELLKDSEKSTKSFFGSYGSQRMKDWLQVIEKYETDNVFLGECTKIIQHNASYEVPALKQRVALNQQKLADSERKEKALKASGHVNKEKFAATCRDIGIVGDNIAAEIKGVASTLPKLMDGVVAAIQKPAFLKAIEFYKAFLGFILDDDHDESKAPTLKLLQYVAKHGNGSVYKYETGLDLPEGGAGAATSSDGADAGGIDFGDDSGGIDFGDDAGGIDFGDSGDAGGFDFGDSGDAGGIDFGDDAGGIDFGDSGDAGGIDFGESGGDAGGIDFGDDAGGIDFGGISAESAGAGGIPPVRTRDTLMQNSTTRNVLVDEILELEGFLAQRAEELSAENLSVTDINLFDGADATVTPSVKDVKPMSTAVKAVATLVTSAKTTQVLMIATSPKYIERLVQSLKQKKAAGESMKTKIKDLDDNREKWRETIDTTKVQLAGLIAQTKTLQGQVEASISKLYKGRKVNYQGDINTM